MVSGFVWIFLYWIWLFTAFLQIWEKRTVFHSSLQAENSFGQVIFKPEVCKSFVTLFYCMCTSPIKQCLVSPMEGSTQPKCVLQCFCSYKLKFCLYLMYCSYNRYCICNVFYWDVAWEPSLQSPKRSGTPRNSVMLSTKKTEFYCFKLVYSLILYVQFQYQVLFSYLLSCSLRVKFPESWKAYITLKSFLELYAVQFGFLQFSWLVYSL